MLLIQLTSSIFDKKFPHARPNWLMGTKGYLMELDGFCPELGIAWEHHGMQHYIINEFSNTEEKLEKRKSDDKLKEKLCRENGIKLIVVPQVPNITKIADLKQFIINECKKFNIPISKNMDELIINSELEPISFEYLKRCQEMIAKSKGGKCLSKVYINCHDLLLFECAEGHQWKASSDNFCNKGSWCRKCVHRKKK